MCAAQQVGVVGPWRYLITERNEDGLFVIVRRDVSRDLLEDEMAFAWSLEVAEFIAAALIAQERRDNWLNSES